MYYFLYQTTNKINNKIYIGVHQTDDLDDGYMGSGDALKKAISKYGKENFETIILEFFDSLEEAYSKEKEIVNDEFVARRDTYNMKLGGNGIGLNYIKKPELKEKMNEIMQSPEYKEKLKKSSTNLWQTEEYREKLTKIFQKPENRERASRNFKRIWANPEFHNKMLKSRQTEEYRKTMSDCMAGRKWMCNRKENKSSLVPPDKCDKYLKMGWEYGVIANNRPKTGYRWLHNDTLKQNAMVPPEEVDELLNDGWVFGMICGYGARKESTRKRRRSKERKKQRLNQSGQSTI